VAVAADSLTAQVRATERPARFDLREHGTGETVEIGRRAGADLSIGAPVRVEGQLWGLIAAGCSQDKPPAAGAEDRLAEFAELLATAIANADTRDKLTASRARVLSAGDQARRRVVRDLHDGAQQHLVHAIVTLKLAQRTMDIEDEEKGTLLAEALDHVKRGNAELRELAHGMLPSVLTRGGLRAGIDALVSRLDLPVEVDVTDERLPPEIEASAYFVAAEGLTNVVKHANAVRARVDASVGAGTLCLQVSDDGDGGADAEGHGLIGLADRVAALGGRLRIESPPEGGTVLTAHLPLPM
jgi:signal transduction histidine kinase